MICYICKRRFIAKRKDSKYCSSKCKKQFTREKDRLNYHSRSFNKICEICRESFQGKYKQKQCDKCRSKRRIKSTKIKRTYCPRCKINITNSYIVKTFHKTKTYSRAMCNKCKEKSLISTKKRMSSDNNPSIQKYGRKKIYSEEENNKRKEKQKRQMRVNNPMYDPKVKQKAKETRAKRSYQYKRGNKHSLWKGNRNRAQTIRSRLYKIWILPILERDQFTCCRCNKTSTQLEVHHIDSFRDILKKELWNKSLEDLSLEEFEEVSLKIEKLHLLGRIRGITYCMPCHKRVDNRRR